LQVHTRESDGIYMKQRRLEDRMDTKG
jgi:hypothetical protein